MRFTVNHVKFLTIKNITSFNIFLETSKINRESVTRFAVEICHPSKQL